MSARSRPRTLARVAVAAGVVLLFFGLAKLATLPSAEAQFEAWRWPGWLVLVVAPAEVVAGALLLGPRTRVLGASIGAVDMAGALFTHARTPGVGLALAPLAAALFAACVWVARAARGTRDPRTAPPGPGRRPEI